MNKGIVIGIIIAIIIGVSVIGISSNYSGNEEINEISGNEEINEISGNEEIKNEPKQFNVEISESIGFSGG